MEYAKGKCGCKVVSAFLVGNTVEYCPLHKAAPALYEALKQIVLEGTQCCNNPDRPIREIYNIDMVDRVARQALAKAES